MKKTMLTNGIKPIFIQRVSPQMFSSHLVQCQIHDLLTIVKRKHVKCDYSPFSAELLKCSYRAATSWFSHKAAAVYEAYQPGDTPL